MFQDKYPVAWLFHRNTSRWMFNMLAMPEEPCEEAPYKEYPGAPFLPLPAPEYPATPLGDAILARRSCRRFADAPLGLGALSSLLKAAYGVQGRIYFPEQEFMERPVPSGGGLYPLELYVIAHNVADLDPGIYHYAALHHALEQIRQIQLPSQFISELFMGQPYMADAGAIVVLTAVVERSMWKYGERGYRYIMFEAGHVAQNLNLMAAALGLGSLNLGGFFDSDIAMLLGLDGEAEAPLYSVALGLPASDDRTELRQPQD